MDWKTEAERLKFDEGMSWTQVADAMQPYFPELSSKERWEKIRGALRRSNRYVGEDVAATRTLALSDFHYPYQLPIETFSDYVGKVDILMLNGDLVDMKEISKFQRAYRQSPMDEIIGCRAYLIALIDYIRPKSVIVTYGNHENRFGKYLARHLDTDLIELMPQTPLELIFDDGFNHYDNERRAKVWYEPLTQIFDERGISIAYTGEWFTKIGKTIFAHPASYASGMLKTTEKAVNFFYRTQKDFDTIVLAHTHKLGSFVQGGVYMFEQGACCFTEQMQYHDGMLTYPQQKGYMYLLQDRDGSLLYDKTRLIKV